MNYKILEKLGFSDKESRVYVAALELGVTGVQELARKAKINRPTAYVILQSLQAKGIINTVNIGGKVRYVVEPPEQLKTMLDQRIMHFDHLKKEVTAALPELKSIYNLANDKPTVRFYEGLEGLRFMRELILRHAGKMMYVAYSLDDYLQVFEEKERLDHRTKRIKKKIKVKAIITSRHGEIPDGKKFLSDRRYVPFYKFPFTSDVTIMDDMVAIASLKGKLSGVVIESVEITKTFRSIFELAWETAGTYQSSVKPFKKRPHKKRQV